MASKSLWNLAMKFAQEEDATKKSLCDHESQIDSANRQDDNSMVDDTSCSDHLQSSAEDGSPKLDKGEFASDSWNTAKTDSFWDDRAVCEVANSTVPVMYPTFPPVPFVIHAPCADATQLAEHFARQAEEYKMMAAQLHVQGSQYEAEVARRSPQEQPVVQGSMPVPESDSTENHTTVMIRNIPNNVTRADLLNVLAGAGFQGLFDFLYLPMDFKKDANLGYAFVNLESEEAADQIYGVFNGFTEWGHPSNKVTEIGWGNMHGLRAHVERYRNSPVMHPDVPDEYKPVVFFNGQPCEFPPPTRPLRAPREQEMGHA
jgi:hypothetical protein